MGRPHSEVDEEKLLDLLEQGWKQGDIAGELGVSKPTLAARIADIQTKQGLILKYRALQSLQLTELQARILEAITPEKIDSASLKDLAGAYKILKDKELTIDGKPTEIKGLVAYLVEMERQQLALDTPIDVTKEPKEEEKVGLKSFNIKDLNLNSEEAYC